MLGPTVQVLMWLGAAVLGGILGAGIPGFDGLAATALTPCLVVLLFFTFLEIPFDTGLRAIGDLRFLTMVVVANFIVVPAVVAVLIAVVDIPGPILPAVLIVLLSPCIDYVIAFTRAARGAADRLLVLTPVLMVAQLLLLPFLLWTVTGGRLSVDLPIRPLGDALLLFIVGPLAIAVLARTIARRRPRVDRAVAAAVKLMDPVMALTLLVITASVTPVIAGSVEHLGSAALIFAVFAAAMTALGWILTRASRLPADQSRAVILSAVTRNSLVMLPLVRAITGEGIGSAAVVTQTLVELVALLLLVRFLPRLVPTTAVSEIR